MADPHTLRAPGMGDLDDPGYWTFVHQVMLADEVRLRRFSRALASAVRPGDVVADIGTGTAVLALLALQGGAERVYAIEANPAVAFLARRVVRANGAEGRIHIVEGDAREVQLPERVDTIVGELLGNFGTDEGITAALGGFAERNLRPGGRVVPQGVRTFLVPVQYRREYRGVWGRNFHGLDLRSAGVLPARPQAQLHFLRRRPRELGPAVPVDDVDLERPGAAGGATGAVALDLPITAPGSLQGFVGYFVAALSPGNVLSNYPCYAGCNWSTWNWPVSPPPHVQPGDLLRVVLARESLDQDALGWRVSWEIVPGAARVARRGRVPDGSPPC